MGGDDSDGMTGRHWPDLLDTLSELGRNGGLISPSIYDTAQVIRYAPPEQGAEPALAWLLAQQAADGGWGFSGSPVLRLVPSLAALLALHQENHSGRFDRPIAAGLAWWNDLSIDESSLDDLPVGAEVILPYLLRDALRRGLPLLSDPSPILRELKARKLKNVALLTKVRGTPAAFSWEAWGDVPQVELLDALGSVGNSPAATASWIFHARGRLAEVDLDRPRDYLRRAAGAAGLGIPGVVPFAWPIDRFEQAFGLYALQVGGLLARPSIRTAAEPILKDLQAGFQPEGLGFSDHFAADVDNTAAAVVVLKEVGSEPDIEYLSAFRNEAGFFTYPGEMHASASAQLRALHAWEVIAGEVPVEQRRVMLAAQGPDGRWRGDKWNRSWIYTTSHALFAFGKDGSQAARDAAGALLDAQSAAGSWGSIASESLLDTAWAVLGLLSINLKDGDLRAGCRAAIQRGRTWLDRHLDDPYLTGEMLWIGKELYTPVRIDRMFVLSALVGNTGPHL